MPKTFTRNTLVDGDCIRLSGRIAVQSGATLIIVAKHGLRISGKVVIDGHGADGARGDASTENPVYPNEEITMGDPCPCARDGDLREKMNGGAGKEGLPGANVQIIANGVDLEPNSGLKILVSGGSQGPQGKCGITRCTAFRYGSGLNSHPCCQAYEPSPELAGKSGLVQMSLNTSEALRNTLAQSVMPQVDPQSPSNSTVVANLVAAPSALQLEIQSAVKLAKAGAYDIVTP